MKQRLSNSTPKYLIAFIVSFLISTTQCFSQAGTLDSTFGINGQVTTDFGAAEGSHSACNAIQKDGKIVVAGWINQYSIDADFALARYLPNGSLDLLFGSNGKVVTHVSVEGGDVSTSAASSVVIQGDGKILVAGNLFIALGQPHYQVIVRYLSNGTLDSSFGVNGIVTKYFYGPVEVKTMALQQDGKILVGGSFTSYASCLVRYNADGTVDSTFGVNGMNLYDFGFEVEDIIVQPDGRILLASITDSTYYEIARIFPDGSFDSSFGDQKGLTQFFLGSHDESFNSIALSKDGSIYGCGSNGNITLIKFKSSGVLDSSFQTNGVRTPVFNESSGFASKVLIQNDGKIILAGSVLGRLYSDGKIDSTFGIDGIANNFNTATYAALQQDGKIVSINPYFTLQRFKGDSTSVYLQRNLTTLEGNSGTTPVTFKIVLNEASTKRVVVNYTTIDGTAKAGQDYVATLGTIIFRPGETTKRVTVNVIGDNVFEKNERFGLQISNPKNTILGTLSTAICTIKNDDASFAITSSTEDDATINNIKLYPNPVKDVLRIDGLSKETAGIISIVDMQGKVISTMTTSNSSCLLNVKQLPAGTYYVRIDEGQNTTTWKLIKE